MTKNVRLIDFQVYAGSAGLADGEQRPINEALFATYEPVRLWLKENKVKAPFRKLLVSFADKVSTARWHGHVANAIGICEVTEAVDTHALGRDALDHRWVLGVVEHALSCVASATGWRSGELEAFVAATSARTPPLVHFFERLTRVDAISGVKCVPWFSTRPGETQIGVRLLSKDTAERDVMVLSKQEPVYLEDTFPMAKAAIRQREYVLLDKSGKVLASVPIDKSAFH